MNSKTIAIDFDGVLHKYSKGWNDGSIYDEPTPGSLEAVNKLIGAGYEVVVHTTRQELLEITKWLEKSGFPELRVTNIKPIARLYVDDRGWRFDGNWETLLKLLI